MTAFPPDSAFSQDDARFHAAIAKASGNDLLHDIITRQRVHLHLFRLHFYARVTQEAIVEHTKILDAFRRATPRRQRRRCARTSRTPMADSRPSTSFRIRGIS